MKNIKIAIVAVVLVIILGVGGFFAYRNNEIKKYSTEIDEQFQKMEKLKGEAYFQSEYNDEFVSLQTEYDKAKDAKKLSDLKKISVDAIFLVENTSKEIESYNEYYKLLKEEIEEADKLLADYFSEGYDVSKLTETKNNAKIAIEKSDFVNYKEIYSSLSSQDNALNQHIEDEMSKIYNTSTGLSDQYPFGVDVSEMPAEWSYKPLIKQKSNFPTWVITSEADTLDGQPYANLFINSSSSEYYYAVNQIDTKKISVQDDNRELKDALVNTEVLFTIQEGYAVDESSVLNERPAYLLKMKSGEIYLALQDYDGSEFYVLYNMN